MDLSKEIAFPTYSTKGNRNSSGVESQMIGILKLEIVNPPKKLGNAKLLIGTLY